MSDEKNIDRTERARRFLSRACLRSSLPYLAVGLLLVIAIMISGHEIKHHINTIEAWITQLGPWGVIAFTGLFILATSFLLPDTVLCIVAGGLFGIAWGAVTVVIGSLLAAVIQFALAHQLLRTRIQLTLAARPSLAGIQRAVSHDEFRLQLLLRLMPLNLATFNYLLGAAGVRFSGFLLAFLVHLPILLIEVYFGYASRHAARLAGGDAHTALLHDLVIFGGLAVCVVMMVLVSRMARKTLMQAVTEAAAVRAGSDSKTA
jgi:uncharacterized membrane protein YdjX (TVP38/TMEM64 family)